MKNNMNSVNNMTTEQNTNQNTKDIEKNKIDIKRLFHPPFRSDMLHPTRLLYALIFATLFIVLGYFTPRFYEQYIDQTNYYTIKQPATVDQESYKQCDKIAVTAVRTSSFNMSVHSTVQLFLVNTNGQIYKGVVVYDGNVIVGISKDVVIHLIYTVPCDIRDGQYYIKGIIVYPLPLIEKTRSYIWVTNSFTIASQSAELN